MIQEGYIFKNSLIHKMNPSLKMLTTIIFIVLIFIPFGFLFQIILMSITLILYFLAKLPLKRLLKIIASIIFMAFILGVINWVSYKSPGAIFDFKNQFNILNNPWWLNESEKNVYLLDGKWFAHGDIWGGQILNGLAPNINGLLTGSTLTAHGGGFYIIDGLTTNAEINLFERNLLESLKNSHPNIVLEFSMVGDQLFLFAYEAEWYSISSFSLGLMAHVTIKVFLIILVISLLTATTSPIEMTYGIEDLLSPFRYLKAPISEWSMTIALSIRFIPSLLDESNRVLRAQASRGVDFKNGNSFDKMKSLASLVVPLFSIAFRKAEELSNAMEARAYNPRNFRTRYRFFPISLFDLLFFGIVLFYFGLVLILCFFNGKPLLFTPFGILDAIMILS